MEGRGGEGELLGAESSVGRPRACRHGESKGGRVLARNPASEMRMGVVSEETGGAEMDFGGPGWF